MVYWITFDIGPAGCLEAPIPSDYDGSNKYDWSKRPPFTEDDAIALATKLTGRQAIRAQSLPYPAAPRLNPQKWPRSGVTPSFCYTPSQCAGRSSCPKRISCVD